MKSLLGKLGVILVGVLIFGYAEVWGADWKLYEQNDNEIRFYDAESITRPSKDIVRVWGKSIDKGNRQNKILFEFNCADKMWRFLSLIHQPKDGIVTEHISDDKAKWEFIPPETVVEVLSKAVCK